MVKLYGDGVHDDAEAIQERLDSGVACVYLPPAKNGYVISKTLRIHSNQELRLDRYTVISLAKHSNCCMLENAEAEDWNENITVTGGVWDMNHAFQAPNPYHFANPDTGRTLAQDMESEGYRRDKRLYFHGYCGHCFRFNSVRGLKLGSLTIVNPVLYGVQLAFTEDFTVEDIYFDYTEGSPKLWNMDGVHIEGGCRNGVVRNLHGTCHDDTVALTSDDGIIGPIENILVDGLFMDNTHSAVRLLSVENPVKNVHITNVYGTYYVYCITISKYYESKSRSAFENITIDHVFASLCKGTVDVPGNYEPLIAVGNHMDVRRLTLEHIYRRETVCPMPLFGLKEDSTIADLVLRDVEQVNMAGAPIPLILNNGVIKRLRLTNTDCGSDSLIEGNEPETVV